MQLPYTSSSLVLWLDPSERYVTKDSNNKVLSVLNRVNEKPIIQTNSSLQPTWNPIGIHGTPSLDFTGSQYLQHNDIASLFTGIQKPITMITVIHGTYLTTNVTISLGNDSGTAFRPFTGMVYSNLGNHIYPLYIDDTGGEPDTFNGATTFSASPHVISATMDSQHVTTRVDGQVTNTVSSGGMLNSHTSTFNNFSIGTYLTAASQHFSLTGSVGAVLLYIGAVDLPVVEAGLMAQSGF